MKELHIEELRAIQLEILQEVHEFCVNNGLQYSLCGGTLLGSVRHQGYIPWDDDIDIMMPREDYDHFINTYYSDRNYLIDFIKIKSYRETFVKVCRKGTMMVDPWGRANLGVNIDVFPIDGVPKELQHKYMDAVLNMKNKISRYCPYYISMPSNKYLWLLKYAVKRFLSMEFRSSLKIKQEFNDMLREQSMKTCECCGVISGSYGHKEVMDKSIFLHYTDALFENTLFKVISNYDIYLSNLYGNYMQLPPEEKRCAPHQYRAFLCDPKTPIQ